MNRHLRATLVAALALSAGLSVGCSAYHNNTLYRREIVFKKHPVALKVNAKYVDEDSPLEYTITFRNVGREVMSFDYTVADERGVPHVDREGPNSGLVANLYPGATAEVPNPLGKRRVWVTLGTVTYGKRTQADVDALYRPSVSSAAAEEIPLQ